MWHSFPADACSDTMARCAAAKLLPFAASLLGAGDETSEDDEASVVPLIVGHAASHASSRRPREQGLNRVRQMKTCVARDGKTHEKRNLPRFSERSFRRASGNALTILHYQEPLYKC
jgi:hypothetical protein